MGKSVSKTVNLAAAISRLMDFYNPLTWGNDVLAWQPDCIAFVMLVCALLTLQKK